MTSSPTRQHAHLIGGALVAAGVVFNKWTVQALLVSDGTIDSWVFIGYILAFQVLAIAGGIFLLKRGRFPKVRGLATVALLSGSLFFTALLAEFAVRFVPNQYLHQPTPRAVVGEYESRPSENFVVDTATGWLMRPNHELEEEIDGRTTSYRSDHRGFRSRSISSTSHRGLSISLVGDSYTFGSGVEYDETFGALLERETGGAVVHNLAMPGYGVDQMLASVEHYAYDLYPDLIIVAFIDNDFDRSLTAYREHEGFTKPTYVVEDGSLRPQTPQDRPNALVRFLERRSHLWTMGSLVFRRLQYRYPLGSWWKVNRAILGAIAEFGSDRDVPILLVRLPETRARAFPQLQRYLDEQGAAYLDLNDPAIVPDSIHFASDPHINAAGHAWVAQEIGNWLRDNLDHRLHNDRTERVEAIARKTQ